MNSNITFEISDHISRIKMDDGKVNVFSIEMLENFREMLSKVPRARFLELEELTSMVCWLSSAENSFSTAAVFDISGGRSTY